MASLALPIYILCTSMGLIFLKMGAQSGLPISFFDGKLTTNLNLFSSLGLGLYAGSFVLYVYLISKYELGFIIPITAALVYIIVFAASFLLFKEAFTTAKVLGIVSILLGLFLLNLGR